MVLGRIPGTLQHVLGLGPQWRASVSERRLGRWRLTGCGGFLVLPPFAGG
jgi:hypothetical protein